MNRRFHRRLKGRSVLVTGATGFVGFHLIRKLSESGARVHALYSSPHSGFPRFGSVEFHRVSLLDFKKLSDVVRRARPAKVVHLGAVVNLERSFEIAKKCVRTNIEGTLNLLEALKSAPFDIFVFLSTAEVYGAGPVPFKETQRESPPSPYAVSKLAGENFCRYYSKVHGYPVSILRLSTCYGPGQDEKRIVPSIIRSCLKDRPVRVNRGDLRRDFIYVDDAASGIVKALTSPKALQELINLGSPKTHSIREIVEEVKSITRSSAPVFYGGAPPRAHETDHWSSSGIKAGRILGWRADTDLRGGLGKTISWYRRKNEQAKTGR